MGTNQSCCVSKQGPTKFSNNHEKPNNFVPSKPARSTSVPYILNEGTPAYESVVTPKSAGTPNGHVSEQNLLKVLNAPSVSSDPQNYIMVQEEKENQSHIPKTLTIPNLDKDSPLLASGQTWEHTQSLDPIKLLAAEQGIDDEVFEKKDNDFSGVKVKQIDATQRKSASEIERLPKVKEHVESTTKSCTVIMEEARSSEAPDKQKLNGSIGSSEIITSVASDPGRPAKVSQSTGNSSTSSSSQYYNIFDVEFRRHNEKIEKSNYNSYSTTYTEYRMDKTPSPIVSTPSTANSPSFEHGKQIRVKAQINTKYEDENSLPPESPQINFEDENYKLYSSVVKEGSLPRRKSLENTSREQL